MEDSVTRFARENLVGEYHAKACAAVLGERQTMSGCRENFMVLCRPGKACDIVMYQYRNITPINFRCVIDFLNSWEGANRCRLSARPARKPRVNIAQDYKTSEAAHIFVDSNVKIALEGDPLYTSVRAGRCHLLRPPFSLDRCTCQYALFMPWWL